MSQAASALLTSAQQLDLYYYLQLNRQLEERMVRLFRQNKIVGGLYSSLGQEAVSVGTSYALEPQDWIAPMIRNIGALLVKGVPPRDVFTQHMAKFTSPTQGKDGTSHFGDLKKLHIVSPISMLGDLIPVMAGVAMAGRYLGQKIVAMTWIASNLVHGRVGRMWMAVRDMDIAAQLIGIRLFQAKLLAFAVSSFYCGVAGALMVFLWLGAAEPEAFSIDQSFLILFMVIIGGLGSLIGSFMGAARS